DGSQSIATVCLDGGGALVPALVRKADICITQTPDVSAAVALYLPELLTTRSSEIPPNPLITRLLNPLPAPVNTLVGFPAPTISSLAEVVVAEPLFAVVPLPVAAALTSSGFAVSKPLYSSTFTFG